MAGLGTDFLSYSDFDKSDWWHRIHPYARVAAREFLDHKWQLANTVDGTNELLRFLSHVVPSSIQADVALGLARSPMHVRLTPYMLSLIDWSSPIEDPVRRQFIPLGSELELEHPACAFDSLGERLNERVPGLIHRYPDRVLFLPLTVCPLYCRFCTRSYAVGKDTPTVMKSSLYASAARWESAFHYIRVHPEVADVVVSGGDVFILSPRHLEVIGLALLDIEHVRRIRFATKGIAALPMKLTSDTEWVTTLGRLLTRAQSRGKQVAIHTHVNHPREITDVTRAAVDRLTSLGLTVRNQTVLIRGVNDTQEVMSVLIKRLAYVNIQPYYVFQHDLVPGTSDMRTPLSTAVELSKALQGLTAGFNTPRFVVDLPGGGGKRDVGSFEKYDRFLGLSSFLSPVVRPGHMFMYSDPLRSIPKAAQEMWLRTGGVNSIIDGFRDSKGRE